MGHRVRSPKWLQPYGTKSAIEGTVKASRVGSPSEMSSNIKTD